MLETQAKTTAPRSRGGSPRGTYRCCLCVEKPVLIWLVTADLQEDEYGLCAGCMLNYTQDEDDLTTLKLALRAVTRPVIPWSTTAEKPPPPKKLEEWEDDLFA